MDKGGHDTHADPGGSGPGVQESEHRRLVEKWIYENLSDEELELLPAEAKARAQDYFRKLVDAGLRSAEEDGWFDGPEAVEKMCEKLAPRRESAT